jgi:hypothetical protein
MKHCAEVARSGLEAPQEVDQLIDRSYTSLLAARSDEHFDTVLRFVREHGEENDRLTALTLYRRIYQGRREPDRTTPAHIALKLSGLVKRDELGLLVVRNRIYRRVFTDAWAKQTMPPVARAIRNARRWGGASALLLVLSAGIWFEGIYPYQLTSRLNAAIAEDRYAPDVYQLLRGIPFYSGRADRLWAGFFDRRAADAELNEKRDEALLWRLKAHSVVATDRRAREAALLIGEDYRQLVRTINLPAGATPHLSADGRVMAWADDHGVRLCQTDNGGPIGAQLGAGELVGLSGDGSVVATVDKDRIMRVWRTSSREPIGKPIQLHSFGLLDLVALSGDGQVVAVGSAQDGVRLWRTESGEAVGKPLNLGGVNFSINMELSGDGKVVAVSSTEGIRLWRVANGQPIGRLRTGPNFDWVLALNEDGSVVASAYGGRVRLWRTANMELIGNPLDGGESLRTVSLSEDGSVVAAGGYRGTVQLWHSGTGLPVGKPLNLGTFAHRIAVSNSGRIVTVGLGIARVWRVVVNKASGDPQYSGNTIQTTPVDQPKANSAQGDPKELLSYWEQKLGLTIGANGQILPSRERERNPLDW